MSQITAPFDAIATAANALAGVMAQLDKDQTAVATAKQAVTNANGTLTSTQGTLANDQQAGQTAADTLVTAIAAAGFAINTQSPAPPIPLLLPRVGTDMPKREPLPTPAEIRQWCLYFQSTWTPEEEQERAGSGARLRTSLREVRRRDIEACAAGDRPEE